MRVFSLDLSTSTGWAVLDDAKLVKFGLEKIEVKSFGLPYPSNLCATAQAMASNLGQIIERHRIPGMEIVIEDTNLGPASQRYAQKILEFTHCSVISQCLRMKFIPVFVNSSDWRKACGIVMSDSDKQKNRSLVTAKEVAQVEVIARAKEMTDRKWNPKILASKTKKEEHDLAAARDAERKDLEAYFLKGVRAPAGKIDYKHLAVTRANELFGTHFRYVDNDIVEAILIGYSRFAGKMKP